MTNFSDIDSKKIKKIVKWFRKKNYEETRNHFIEFQKDAPSIKGQILDILIKEYPEKSNNDLQEVLQAVFKHAMLSYKPEVPKTIPNDLGLRNKVLIERNKARKELKNKLKHRR